jgi:glycosyltransferase involved in cell wall biosynthesis
MGQLIPRKGIDILLQALAELATQNILFDCTIAGTGEQKAELETLCDELRLTANVRFVGQINNPIEFLADSDIFCFPTLGEGFPISPIEAFAAGCAVIGTDDPGTAELLEHGRLGLVVPRRDVQAFADALIQLIQNPEQCFELARKAQQRYLERYTPENAKARFLQALEESIHQFKYASGSK